MFDLLTAKLQKTFDGLTGRGKLSEEDVTAALRELRIALLEADVALPAIKHLLAEVKEQAVGDKVLKSVTPGQQVVKIVHDALLNLLGEAEPLNIDNKPAIILMCGLQGSGKTTTSGKLAKKLIEQSGKSVLMASADIYRPAAQEQLQTLAEKTGATFLPIKANEKPAAIAKRALAEAKNYDVLIFDTSGRLELDADLLNELSDIHKVLQPQETLLVADALTGQTAVQIAEGFKQTVPLTGLVLTRIDGDGRGGAALSLRFVTGVPIKFLGRGEDLGALDTFRPEGLADRILGQGDVVALVEQAAATVNQDDMMAMMDSMMSGKGFDLIAYKKQLQMIQKMASGQGGMLGLLKLMPGVGKMMKQAEAAVKNGAMDEKQFSHQIAVIDSMTVQERIQPDILNARRRQRIAKGAGVEVSVVNKLIKTHKQMNTAMKQMNKMGGPMAMMQAMQGGRKF